MPSGLLRGSMTTPQPVTKGSFVPSIVSSTQLDGVTVNGNRFSIAQTGSYILEAILTVAAPSAGVPYTLQLVNVTLGTVVQEYPSVCPSGGQPFNWTFIFGFSVSNPVHEYELRIITSGVGPSQGIFSLSPPTIVIMIYGLADGGGSSALGVLVNNFATGGTGTSVDPWTGWDTNIVWSANTTYYFPKGYYSYAASPNFCQTGLALVGESSTGTVLKYTGAGTAVVFQAPAGQWKFSMRMENMTVQGHAGASQGIWWEGIRGSVIRNIIIKDFVNEGLYTTACVTNVCDNLYLPHDMTVKPKNGVRLASRGTDNQTTTWLFTNLIVEAATEKGIWIEAAFWNVFNEGAAENLAGQGMYIGAPVGGFANDGNVFTGFDFELNNQVLAGDNVEVRGNCNQFLDCNATGLFRIVEGKAHQMQCGNYFNVTVNLTATSPIINSLMLSGTFVDNSGSAILMGTIDGTSSGLPLTTNMPPNRPKTVALVSGATVASPWNQGNFMNLVVFDTFVLSNPTGATANQEVRYRFTQGNAAANTITLGAKFDAGTFVVALNVGAGQVAIMDVVYDSARDKFDVVKFVKGYA